MEKSIATFKFRDDNTHLATGCMVCGEPTEIQSIKYPFGICNKCKAAILKMRDAMGKSNDTGLTSYRLGIEDLIGDTLE